MIIQNIGVRALILFIGVACFSRESSALQQSSVFQQSSDNSVQPLLLAVHEALLPLLFRNHTVAIVHKHGWDASKL